jgi:broad specificity phosphatase PhoE
MMLNVSDFFNPLLPVEAFINSSFLLKQMDIFIARHPTTELNEIKAVQRHSDANLSEKGKKELSLLIKRLESEDIEKIYTSDSPRCLIASKEISEELGVPLVKEPLLREIDRGRIFQITQLPSWEEMQKKGDDWSYPSGESFADVKKRASVLYSNLISSKDERVLLLTHSGWIRAFVAHILGMEAVKVAPHLKVINAGLTMLIVKDKSKPFATARFYYINESAFLR